MRKSINRILHITLLLAILLGSLAGPITISSASSQVDHPLDETLLLLANAELWATGGGAPVEALNRPPGLSSPSAPRAGSARQIEVSINAVKEVIAIKQAVYEQSSALLEGNVSAETLQAHEEKHLLEMNQLNGALEELRQEWRREKRFLPKLIQPFKQAGGWFWHQIGPAGRQILRLVGDDLIQLVVAGDPISGRIVKMLILKHARLVGKERGKELLVRLILRERPAPADIEPVTTDADGEGEPADSMTIDEIWPTVLADLETRRLHCNRNGLIHYKECLATSFLTAGNWESALESCSSFPERTLRPFPERVTLENAAYEHNDDDNYITLTYDIDSGEVSGRYEVIWLRFDPNVSEPDPVPCTVTMIYNFAGRVSAADCTLVGTGVRTLAIDDSVNCIGMESSVGSFDAPLEAKIDNGLVWGLAGDLSFSLDLVEHAK